MIASATPTALKNGTLNVKAHFASCFCFWRPSMARRITVYFVIFGLIVFYASTLVYMITAKKHFIDSTHRLVQHQLDMVAGSRDADFLWYRSDTPQPGLYDLTRILSALSSTFYTVQDIAFYCLPEGRTDWYRFDLGPDKVLRKQQVPDRQTKALERGTQRAVWEGPGFALSNETLAVFFDITRPGDRHHYYLRLSVDKHGLAGLINRKLIHLLWMTLLALVLLRLLGYSFARRLARPIEVLSRSAEEVARGDLSVRVPTEASDEIGNLSRNFNQMVRGLQERENVRLLEFELEKGRQIQRDFLPRQIPQLPDWDIAAFFDPARQVSGDFYDVFPLADGHMGLVIADVCDKGVGSAFYMALFRSLIRIYAEQQATQTAGGSPPDPTGYLLAMKRTNDYIARNHSQDAMFATVFFGVLDPASGDLWYINAGHEPLFVVRAGQIRHKLSPTGPALGLSEEIVFRTEHITMMPGELLMGYTDGVTDARSPDDEMFSRLRLRALLAQPITTAPDLLDRVRESLFRFIGKAPRLDDVTMIAVQRL
jgi:serine phosphatase RsbU (regulator of sigma subunit)